MEQQPTKPKGDLTVIFKLKKRPRFKAGADLTDKVNLVSIEVEEERTDESEMLFINICLQRSTGTTAPVK